MPPLPTGQGDVPLFHLRRRMRPRSRRIRGLLDVAPWIDVVLLVMIFFMVNTATSRQPGVQVTLPTAPMTGGALYGSAVLTVLHDGMMFFRDQRTSMDRLPAALASLRQEGESSLVIEADGRVSHQTLVDIYNLAVTAGLQDVLLATREPVAPGLR